MFRLLALCAMVVVFPCTAAVQDAAETNNYAAVKVYGEVMKKEGNILYSPYSFMSAMGTATVGSWGETLKEIINNLIPEKNVVTFPEDQGLLTEFINTGSAEPAGLAGFIDHVRSYILSWTSKEIAATPLVLRSANALWVDNAIEINPAFLNMALNVMHGTIARADFQRAAETARGRINSWVSDYTEGGIKDLIAAGSVDSNTRLVIANALYMKADWEHPFNAQSTAEQPFNLGDAEGSTIPCSLMFQKGKFRVAVEDGYSAIELPYFEHEGSALELVMRVYLPSAPDGLAALEDRLVTKGELIKPKAFESRETVLYLPKFNMSDTHSLPETLKKLGVVKAFSDEADFSGITASASLSISDIVQKTFIEVDESGTTAGAATAIVMQTRMASVNEPFLFRADHPFLYTVVEKTSGTVLFIGRLAQPAQ